jgi:hypothetical protein
MQKEINLPVPGVEGNVGQGILKALFPSSFKCRVIDGCISVA